MRSRFLSVFLLLLFPVSAFAHAGIMDRWIEQETNVRACSMTVLAVQLLLLLLFLVFFKHSRLNSFVRSLADSIANTHFLSILVFWGLFAFCLTPFISMLNCGVLFGGLFAVLLSFVLFVLAFYEKPRKLVNRPSSHYYLIHCSIQQIIGYFVYFIIYDTDFIRNLFRYTDDEYQLANYYVYPDARGISLCWGCFTDLLLGFSFALVVCFCFELISWRKSSERTDA